MANPNLNDDLDENLFPEGGELPAGIDIDDEEEPDEDFDFYPDDTPDDEEPDDE